MAASAYTQEQVSHYLDYIDFPRELRSGPRDLHFLTVLHAHQISKIPYDNLSLHYNASHSNNLDPALLYDKFTRNGRGGYCMETTVFFRHILRALGFNVYSAGARIRMRKDGVPHGPFSGWRHCTNIVTFEDGQKYSTDVGFGGDGPVRPLPLVKTGGSTPNLGSQEVRLRWGPLPDSTDPINQQFWIYEYRNSPSQDWNPYYAFPELEFFEPDFMILNYYTSVHPDSFQRHMPLVIRFIRDGPQIVGKIMLAGDKVKRNMGGRTETLLECKTEAERVQALEEYLGVTLTPEQVEGIKGFRTELVSGNGQRAPPIL